MSMSSVRTIDTVMNHPVQWMVTWLDQDGFILLSIMTNDLVGTVSDPNFHDRGGAKTYSIVVKQV